MNKQETILQKYIFNSSSHGYRGLSTENRPHTNSRNFGNWIRDTVKRTRPDNIIQSRINDASPTIANREVHLEGYKSHEDVVRAYLEFAGIDPNSKEARLYFEL